MNQNNTDIRVISKELFEKTLLDIIDLNGGVTVRFIKRIKNRRKKIISESITSYSQENKLIPESWVKEYNEIINNVNKKSI